jgi:TetR/AcrR family transcriptional regulator, repressor for uid operon
MAVGTVPVEANTRDRLLAAAVEVFLAQGYEQAKVNDIARAAGMTTGAIYSQYRGKAALLLDAISTRTREEVETLLTLASGAEARAVLAELGLRLATRADKEPTLVVDVVAAARRDPTLAEQMRDVLTQREQLIADLMERAQRAGDIDPALDPRAIARFCVTILLGSLCLRNVDMPVVELDAWSALLDRVLAAAAPPAPSPNH